MMVASAEKVTVSQLKTALASAEHAGTDIMGIVLNRVLRHRDRSAYYGYPYATDAELRGAKRKRPAKRSTR